jgi:hypothetical protein
VLQSGALEGVVVSINEANWDRALRIAGGLALMAQALTGAIGYWGWIGVVPFATGLIGNCPLYAVLGFGTCSLARSD